MPVASMFSGVWFHFGTFGSTKTPRRPTSSLPIHTIMTSTARPAGLLCDASHEFVRLVDFGGESRAPDRGILEVLVVAQYSVPTAKLLEIGSKVALLVLFPAMKTVVTMTKPLSRPRLSPGWIRDKPSSLTSASFRIVGN